MSRLVLLPIALFAAVTAAPAPAQQSSAPKTPTASHPPAPPVPSTGRLTPFSDRGLALFSDRQLEGFGRRGLESFSDIPLAPMGGVEIPGPSARRGERSRSGRSLPRAPRVITPIPSGSAASTATASTQSVASIHGVTLPPVGPAPALVMPAIALPELPIDPRPALAKLEQSLQGELERARSRGDADLVRTLAASLQR